MAENRGRAKHGDAPRWILVHVLATFVGITLGVLLYGLVLSLAGVDEGGVRPGILVTVAVVLILLSLAGQAQKRRPLIAVDRTYYRLALLFIGLYGGLGAWWVGTLLGVLLLAHSLVADKEVRESGQQHPVTRDAPL